MPDNLDTKKFILIHGKHKNLNTHKQTVVRAWEKKKRNGQGSMVNGLLFHMTQPTSISIIKAIACSKPIVREH